MKQWNNNGILSMSVLKMMFGFSLVGYESCVIFQNLILSDRSRMKEGGWFWKEKV